MISRPSLFHFGVSISVFKPKYYLYLRWTVILLCFGVYGCAAGVQRPPDSSRVQPVIQLAKSLLGKPYRYGGTTPKGFDCSGFVQYVFRQATGVRMPRTSRAQFSATRPVRLGSEKPSDLLFFDISGRGISHVGIYLGRGKFIHAPKSGGQVKISDANKKYWRQHFRGVRRAL